MAEANFGRIAGIAAAVVLVAGTTIFFLFRYTFSAERLFEVQTALGIEAPPPVRHILPAGFQGWAIIHYGIVGTPALAEADGILVAEYPESGRIETSTEPPENDTFLNHEYFERTGGRLTPLNRLGQIWGEYHMRIARDDEGRVFVRSSGFFVGSMAEFRSSERPVARPDPPKPPARNQK
jgi:hypothetical protein